MANGFGAFVGGFGQGASNGLALALKMKAIEQQKDSAAGKSLIDGLKAVLDAPQNMRGPLAKMLLPKIGLAQEDVGNFAAAIAKADETQAELLKSALPDMSKSQLAMMASDPTKLMQALAPVFREANKSQARGEAMDMLGGKTPMAPPMPIGGGVSISPLGTPEQEAPNSQERMEAARRRLLSAGLTPDPNTFGKAPNVMAGEVAATQAGRIKTPQEMAQDIALKKVQAPSRETFTLTSPGGEHRTFYRDDPRARDAMAQGWNEVKAPVVQINQGDKISPSLQEASLKDFDKADLQQSIINDLEMTRNLLLSGKVPTGITQPMTLPVRRFLKEQLGFGVSDKAEDVVSLQQFMTAQGNQIALRFRNPASGFGLTGNTSDRDLMFLKELPPGIEKTPQANIMLTDLMIARGRRERDLAQLRASHIEENSSLKGYDKVRREFIEKTPLFTPEEQARMKVLATTARGPERGTVVDGYRFKGGDPKDQNNWVKVQ